METVKPQKEQLCVSRSDAIYVSAEAFNSSSVFTKHESNFLFLFILVLSFTEKGLGFSFVFWHANLIWNLTDVSFSMTRKVVGIVCFICYSLWRRLLWFQDLLSIIEQYSSESEANMRTVTAELLETRQKLAMKEADIANVQFREVFFN